MQKVYIPKTTTYTSLQCLQQMYTEDGSSLSYPLYLKKIYVILVYTLNLNEAWLNNCVGYNNHRYFFLYMAYMVVGVLFVIMFGIDIGYTALWAAAEDLDEPELIGHPVKFNKSGALIPVVSKAYNYC